LGVEPPHRAPARTCREGVQDVEDGALRERLICLKLQRDEIAEEIGDHQKRMSSDEPIITPAKIDRAAIHLRDKLHNGPPELKQAYARLLMDEVRVTEDEIRIAAPKPSWREPHPRAWNKPRLEFSLLFGIGAPDNIKMRTLRGGPFS
jgi:hypothetical protein